MKRHLTLLLLLLAVTATAQQLKVNSFAAKPVDLTASTQMRRDANNDPCALVKVVLPHHGAEFEGNTVGDTRLHTNEYWVYMTAGSKFLNVKLPSAKPLLVRFPDYGVDGLQARTTYVLDIEAPKFQAATTQQQVLINFTPATAMVIVNGKMLDTANGVATVTLPADKEYSYIVAAKGYESSEGTFRLKSTAPTRLNIQLYPESSTPATVQPAVQQTAPQPVTQQPAVDVAATRREAEKAYNDGYYNRCMELCLQIQNDSWAQAQIGLMYEKGKGVQKNYQETVRWYRKAAEQGYATAQSSLGYMYYNGNGVKQDYQEAVRWYRKAAEQGDATAQSNLGNCYYNGLGVQKDEQEAVKWYRKSAEQDNNSGMYNYGLALYYGLGVSKNKQEAYKWIKKSADNGDDWAKRFLKEHSF